MKAGGFILGHQLGSKVMSTLGENPDPVVLRLLPGSAGVGEGSGV